MTVENNPERWKTTGRNVREEKKTNGSWLNYAGYLHKQTHVKQTTGGEGEGKQKKKKKERGGATGRKVASTDEMSPRRSFTGTRRPNHVRFWKC